MRSAVLICILFSCVLLWAFADNNSRASISDYQVTSDPLKKEAFEVLENNCNECHQKKKKEYVFTLENMEGFASKINTEVFIKKKMPKGKKNKLSAADSQTLKKWIESVFNAQ